MLVNRIEKRIFGARESINIGGKLISLKTPKVMGILNITPDSFFDGGEYLNSSDIELRVTAMVDDGVDIIDVGGYSTRPGASDIALDEEIRRVSKAISIIRDIAPETPISLDTFRSEVVKEVTSNFGAVIVNDISGGTMDSNMFKTVAELSLPYILMHIQGTPSDMQEKRNCQYNSVTEDIIKYLANRVGELKLLGLCDIIVDPGFGFGKDLDQNFELLNRLDNFKVLELPILAGVSRKSMIWKTLETTAQESMNGTTALNMAALIGGATILRVHDVKEAVQTVKLYNSLK